VGRAIIRFNPDSNDRSNNSDDVGGESEKDGSLLISGGDDTTGFQNGIVVDVVIEDPGYGYLYAPDGSQGGGGRTFSNYCETLVRRADGTYDVPYVSGDVIKLNVGDWIKFPDQAPTKITTAQSLTAPTCPEKPDQQIANPTDTTNSYQVDLVIDDFEIIDSGYNYIVGDTIEVEDNPGFVGVVDAVTSNGAIKGISINNPGSSIVSYPEVVVNSANGFNAKIAPRYKVTRLTPEEVERKRTQGQGQQLISVIDCVGKF